MGQSANVDTAKPKTGGVAMKDQPWQFKLLATIRAPMFMFVVIPISFARRRFVQFRSWARMLGLLGAVKTTHEERVATVVQDVRAWIKDGRKGVLRTMRPNWQRMATFTGSHKGDCHRINVSHLNHILKIDEEAMTITVEPSCTHGEVTAALHPRGFALELQIEMESITIGGNALGFGIETNSHRVGFFQETVTAYELLTPDGELRNVTAESDPELFYAMPWSHGTLGFCVALTVRMIKIKPYVRVKYIPTKSLPDLQERMLELAQGEDSPDFCEATMYSETEAVIQIGDYSDEPTDRSKINPANLWYKPFYYMWVKSFLNKGEFEEYIPVLHYYNRFSRSLFWELEDMVPWANNPLYRLFWGWMGPPEVSLLKLFQGPVVREAAYHAHVVQESICPLRHLQTGIRKFAEWFDTYPLLVFPVRVYDRGELSGFLTPCKEDILPHKNYGMWVDIGAYGVPRKVQEGQAWDAKENVRAMEHWTREVGGWQALYTDVCSTHRELRQMFNHTLWDKCRARLGAIGCMPTVFDKIRPEPGIVDLSAEEAAEAKMGPILSS